MRRSLLVIAAAWLAAPAPARAEVVRDAQLGFTLTLPDGFVDFPRGRGTPDTVWSFARGDPAGDDFAIVGVERMHGTIGREPLPASALPRVGGVAFEARREKWKSFEIDVIAGRAEQEGVRLFVLVAQVPLKREAVQLKLAGPAAKEAELGALMRTLLARLDGPSNWLTDGERAESAVKAGFWLTFTAGMLGWTIWSWRRRRKS
jgi:hypothetical protein